LIAKLTGAAVAFWSDVTLKGKLPVLIDKFNPDYVKGASYELGVGDEVYVTPSHEAKPSDRVKQRLSQGASVNIPRGQFAFLITDEVVNVPVDAIAFISIKAKIKFRGLVNISGFHVDPGYSGRLVFSVFNAGASDVVLDCNERAFLIWYASLDTASSSPKTGRGYMNIPSELVNGISDDTLSLAVLDDKLKSVSEQVKKIYIAAGVVITLASLAKILGFSLPQGSEPTQSPPVPKVQEVEKSDFSYPPRFDYLDCSLMKRNVEKQSCN
jgi:dCTP deaminase